MKPYPRALTNIPSRIFNYRLSCARRMVESAFGILANRFRVFLNPIALESLKVKYLVLAGCCLHNFLCIQGDGENTGMFDMENIERGVVHAGQWRSDVRPRDTYLYMRTTHSNNSTGCVKAICNEYRDYFMSDVGSIHWQYRFV